MILLNCTVIFKYNYHLKRAVERIIVSHYVSGAIQMNVVYVETDTMRWSSGDDVIRHTKPWLPVSCGKEKSSKNEGLLTKEWELLNLKDIKGWNNGTRWKVSEECFSASFSLCSIQAIFWCEALQVWRTKCGNVPQPFWWWAWLRDAAAVWHLQLKSVTRVPPNACLQGYFNQHPLMSPQTTSLL